MYEYDAGTYIAIITLVIIGSLVIGGLIVENITPESFKDVKLTDSNVEEYDKELVNSKTKFGLLLLSFAPA